jgi:hypothetical protein
LSEADGEPAKLDAGLAVEDGPVEDVADAAAGCAPAGSEAVGEPVAEAAPEVVAPVDAAPVEDDAAEEAEEPEPCGVKGFERSGTGGRAAPLSGVPEGLAADVSAAFG